MASNHTQLHLGKFEPSQKVKTLAYAFIGIGILGFIVGLMQNPGRMWSAYLTGFFFVCTLSLGGMFFVAVNNLTKAGWSVTIRRYTEAMASFIPAILIGAMILLMGAKHLYAWALPEAAAHPMIKAKLAYLNLPFMAVRILVFSLGCWAFFKMIVGNSLKQDASGDEQLTHKNVGLSIAYILFFAVMFSLFSVDLLMSLLPTWYSTIFGIYAFAGAAQSSFAFLILMIFFMKRAAHVEGYVTIEHVHDCAKYLKGFTVFWAYIAFSQFMLIWYANIPEETEFFILRAQKGWMSISMALLVFKFIVPFLALLPRAAKRNEKYLIAVCFLILATQYLDIYWLVYPNFNDNHVVLGFYEIALLLGFVGVFLAMLIRFFQKHSPIALKDPRIHEAVAHHVTY